MKEREFNKTQFDIFAKWGRNWDDLRHEKIVKTFESGLVWCFSMQRNACNSMEEILLLWNLKTWARLDSFTDAPCTVHIFFAVIIIECCLFFSNFISRHWQRGEQTNTLRESWTKLEWFWTFIFLSIHYSNDIICRISVVEGMISQSWSLSHSLNFNS